MATVEDYYNGSDHGSYQYVTFNSIIEDLVEDSLDQDSYLKNTKRSQFIKHAVKGVRVMNFNVLNAVKGIEIDIPPSLSMILPVDYVDWVRVSVIKDDGFLYTLGENKRMPTAISYLQDNEYNILFDQQNGEPLQGDSSDNAFAAPFERRQIERPNRGALRNIDTSKYNINGEFKIDKERGAIAFSSEISERSIIFEYVSDGLEDKKIWNGSVQVHKYIVDAVHDYVYWQIIRKRRNVNATEKAVARAEYFNSRRIAKQRTGSISVNEIMKAMSSSSKWI